MTSKLDCETLYNHHHDQKTPEQKATNEPPPPPLASRRPQPGQPQVGNTLPAAPAGSRLPAPSGLGRSSRTFCGGKVCASPRISPQSSHSTPEQLPPPRPFYLFSSNIDERLAVVRAGTWCGSVSPSSLRLSLGWRVSLQKRSLARVVSLVASSGVPSRG